MLDSTAIRMQAEPGRGLYESFYFRGTSPDAQQAFWLKHNMFRYQGTGDVWLEASLVLFDRGANKTSAVYAHQALDDKQFERMSQIARDWEHVALDLRNGSVRISRSHLGGELVGEGGRAYWDLQLRRSGIKHQPFPNQWMYNAPWPANKLLTRDCHMDFHGSVWAGDLAFSGLFHGMNGHSWGSRHPRAAGYANCTQFSGREGNAAYFEGFSARVALVGGLIATPYLSMSSLHVGGHWHHFNRLRDSVRQKVKRLDDHGWQAEMCNESHRLEIDIDGGSPASLPWSALHYAQPDRKRVVVKNTKFATLKLRLCRRSGELEDELFSEACELETLLPGNAPVSTGFIGKAA